MNIHIDEQDDNQVVLGLDGDASSELYEIVTQHLPEWLSLFAAKNAEYGSGAAFALGERGQFSDIYRKILKLKRFLWDEPESVPEFEGVSEILQDLIGHCFLTLVMIDRKNALRAKTIEKVKQETDVVEQVFPTPHPDGDPSLMVVHDMGLSHLPKRAFREPRHGCPVRYRAGLGPLYTCDINHNATSLPRGEHRDLELRVAWSEEANQIWALGRAIGDRPQA